MEEKLQDIGLSEMQAKVYLYMLGYSAGRKPKQITEALGITRTNTYKILDSLEEIDLVSRSVSSATLTYYAENPIALTSLVADARNHARKLEATVKEAMHSLQNTYQKNVRNANVQVAHGRTAIIHAHKKQIKPGGEIYFIKSRADIPFLGFETIRSIRYEPSRNGMKRFAITPNTPEIDRDPAADKRTNLTRVLIPMKSYTSSVEWTVSGDETAIINYSAGGTVIRIKDAEIADSFRQIWNIAAKHDI